MTITMNFELVKLTAKATNLTAQERALMLIFCDYADNNGLCFPSFETLSERINLKRRQTINIVNSLLEKGVLTKINLEPKSKISRSNVYKIIPEMMPPFCKENKQNEQKATKNDSAIQCTSSEVIVQYNASILNSTVQCSAPSIVQYNAPSIVQQSAPEVYTLEVDTVEVNNLSSAKADDCEISISRASASQKIIDQKIPNCPYEKIIEVYHRILPTAPRVIFLSASRKRHIHARWKDQPDMQVFETLFSYISESDFLLGRTISPGRRPFKISIDWIMNAQNFIKILEGKYFE